MVSALLLSQISERIAQAKGHPADHVGQPFGGVNVIFLGDFGQLKPVQMRSLFAHELVSSGRDPSTIHTVNGQRALSGACLWRTVPDVIELKKNWRQQEDPVYADLVSRVRTEADSVERFDDCPIIVANKQLRDAINERVIAKKAKELNKAVACYVACD
ncbi:hypothetical protein FA95DRAFT_1479719, partial [Auriscalpium vulgare]